MYMSTIKYKLFTFGYCCVFNKNIKNFIMSGEVRFSYVKGVGVESAATLFRWQLPGYNLVYKYRRRSWRKQGSHWVG